MLKRHVLYDVRDKQTREVWGPDRVPANLQTVPAPRARVDCDDPLRDESGACTPLFVLRDGCHVTWSRIMEFLSEADEAGYEVVSGFKHLSPYSQIVLRGP